jgi:hypothetical protein
MPESDLLKNLPNLRVWWGEGNSATGKEAKFSEISVLTYCKAEYYSGLLTNYIFKLFNI